MTVKWHGRRILRFRVRDENGNLHDIQIGSRDYLRPLDTRSTPKVTQIYFSGTHHGDHDQFWIVQIMDDGNSRMHNVKAVEFFDFTITEESEAWITENT